MKSQTLEQKDVFLSSSTCVVRVSKKRGLWTLVPWLFSHRWTECEHVTFHCTEQKQMARQEGSTATLSQRGLWGQPKPTAHTLGTGASSWSPFPRSNLTRRQGPSEDTQAPRHLSPLSKCETQLIPPLPPPQQVGEEAHRVISFPAVKL